MNRCTASIVVCSLEVVALASCRRRDPGLVADPVASGAPTAVRVAPPASVDAAPAESPPALPPDSCADYRARIDKSLHAAIVAIGDAGLRYGGTDHWTEPALKTAIDDAGLHCSSFARGAWWIEPGPDLDLHEDLEISTHTTVRASLDGRAPTPWTPDPGGIDVGYGGMPTTMRNALAGDYDGDGVPELWVRTDEDGVEGGHFVASWVLTIHDGAIREYAPAKSLGDIAEPFDADGDGRLDLPVTLGLGMRHRACFGKDTWAPAKLLAHALPNGAFSTTDDIAQKWAKKWCPAKPAMIATREAALCARLRTAPADLATVRARIASSCVPWDCRAEIDGKPQLPRADQECNDILATFDQKTSMSLLP